MFVVAGWQDVRAPSGIWLTLATLILQRCVGVMCTLTPDGGDRCHARIYKRPPDGGGSTTPDSSNMAPWRRTFTTPHSTNKDLLTERYPQLSWGYLPRKV